MSRRFPKVAIWRLQKDPWITMVTSWCSCIFRFPQTFQHFSLRNKLSSSHFLSLISSVPLCACLRTGVMRQSEPCATLRTDLAESALLPSPWSSISLFSGVHWLFNASVTIGICSYWLKLFSAFGGHVFVSTQSLIRYCRRKPGNGSLWLVAWAVNRRGHFVTKSWYCLHVYTGLTRRNKRIYWIYNT